MKPPFWSKPAYELDPTDPANNGFINQDFLVWMRRAALPDFRKLYRRITEGDYQSGLPAGNYSLEISYSILFIYRSRYDLKVSIYCDYWNLFSSYYVNKWKQYACACYLLEHWLFHVTTPLNCFAGAQSNRLYQMGVALPCSWQRMKTKELGLMSWKKAKTNILNWTMQII